MPNIPAYESFEDIFAAQSAQPPTATMDALNFSPIPTLPSSPSPFWRFQEYGSWANPIIIDSTPPPLDLDIVHPVELKKPTGEGSLENEIAHVKHLKKVLLNKLR